MPIISALPFNIQNGTLEDATQVMANFNQIVANVNNNLAATGGAALIGALASTNNSATTVQGQLTNIGSATGATFIGYTPAASGIMIGATLQAALDNFNAVAPPSPWSGFAERTINGDMRIDQRNQGSSQTITSAAATAYTVDRFYAYCTGANVTGQQNSGTGVDQFTYRFTGAASVTAIGFGQRYESFSIFDLAGSTVTFSVVLANSLLTTVTWTAYYPTSIDTWPTNNTGRTLISTGTFTVTSTPTKYSAQISLPTNVQAGLEIELTVGAQVSGTFSIGRFSLIAGSNPQTFERRPIGTELALCQRYLPAFNSNGTQDIIGSAYAGTATGGEGIFTFPVQARTNPTGLVASAASTFTMNTGGNTSAGSAISFNRASQYAALVNLTIGATTVGFGGFWFGNSASAKLLFNGCEL